MTAGPSLCNKILRTWLLVRPMVEIPSIWWIRSPGARKSEAGPNAFIVAIIGGYDKSVLSAKFSRFKKITVCRLKCRKWCFTCKYNSHWGCIFTGQRYRCVCGSLVSCQSRIFRLCRTHGPFTCKHWKDKQKSINISTRFSTQALLLVFLHYN